MKRLHRTDLFTWSQFREPLNIDFNATLWTRPGGNVLIDPLALSAHDQKHLEELGGAAFVIITNSMHVRAASEHPKAQLFGPRAEKDNFPVKCSRWLGDGEEVFPGLIAYELDGSKTPGELALVLDGTTLITGDLIRAHRADTLGLLKPEQNLKDKQAALASIQRVMKLHPGIEHIVVGDGWHCFCRAKVLLERLLTEG
ncbi:MAG: MBL fold metallo-hydrolase [Archangium sp.]|nr:MBL fold metallo-hydrolase [Archangium sp.]